MIDILERFLQQINLHRSPINRITYNVVSSTTAADYIRSMHGEDADCDSMLLISLCYGKQIAVTEARAKEDSRLCGWICRISFFRRSYVERC